MNKKRIAEIVDSYFNVDDEYSDKELESFSKEHSLISIGAVLLFTVIVVVIVLFLASHGANIEIDHIKSY